MKPQLLQVSKNSTHSFSARRDTMPDINNRWHYHPEVELVYFKEGSGTQYVGDNISSFNTGDIVLVGANLPHYWQFDGAYFDGADDLHADVVVIHFNELFWGELFLNLPENKEIRQTLEKARQGIVLKSGDNEAIGVLMERLISAEGVQKIMLLMDVLLHISHCGDSKLLASVGFQHHFQESEKDRFYAIYNYSIANFQKRIALKEIATVANVSPGSFCKYFKSRSRKTYSQFINEIRVGHACKLLMDSEMNVKEICFESGFNNFASFHKFFKKITGKSPLTYQKSFLKN